LAFQLSDLQHLIHQLGPSIPEISAIFQEGSDSWQISFDEGPSIQLSWQEKPVSVLLCCAVGKPDSGNREKVFTRLLNMNLLLQGAANINLKLALSSPEDDVILIGELECYAMSVEALQTGIIEYLRFAAYFSELIINPEIENEKVDFPARMSTELMKV